MDNCYFPNAPHDDRNQMDMLMMMNQFGELSESATIPSPPPTTFYNPVSTNQFPYQLHESMNELPMIKPNNSNETMREMIFKIGAMQPIEIDPESVKPPKRRHVKISKDPQSVAARQRRGRISEKIRILRRLVPGGMKMDTASMLDEAICYVKFLKKQIVMLENGGGDGGGDYFLAGGGGMSGFDY